MHLPSVSLELNLEASHHHSHCPQKSSFKFLFVCVLHFESIYARPIDSIIFHFTGMPGTGAEPPDVQHLIPKWAANTPHCIAAV